MVVVVGVIPFRHGLRLPSALCWKVQVREEALHTLNLEAPSPAGGHLGARGGWGSRLVAVATRPGAAPATPSPPGSLTRLRPFANRLARKLSASPVSGAAGSVVCGRASRAWRAPRHGHRGALQHAGWVPAVRVGGGGRRPRCSGSQSGNDDSEFFRPQLPLLPVLPTFLVISQLLSACPGDSEGSTKPVKAI